MTLCCAEHSVATALPLRPSAHARVILFDPTRTIFLRRQFEADIAGRFRKLRGVIRKAIVDDDCFGLQRNKPFGAFAEMTSPGFRAFDFPRSSDKVSGFMGWLKKQEETGILEVSEQTQLGQAAESAWTNKYIKRGYEAGVTGARADLRRAGFGTPSIPASGGIAAVMSQPFHADRVGLLYTRTFSDLKGITQTMDGQISRVLAEGIATGVNPTKLARTLNKTISGPVGGLGITDSLGRFIPAERRARMLARTEIIRAHHHANIQELRNWEVEGVKVEVEWTLGGSPCNRCSGMTGKQYTLDEIEPLIPVHPNCKCRAVPIPPSRLRKGTHRGQKGGKPIVGNPDDNIIARPSKDYPPLDPNGKDTMSKYMDKDGNWTPERQSFHDATVRKHFEGLEPVPVGKTPTAQFLGGGPASGKTRGLGAAGVDPKKMVHIDPDNIKTMIPEYREMTTAGNKLAAGFAHEESSYLSKRIMKEAAKRRYNVLIDGTGDGKIEKLIAKIDVFKDKGFRIEANYMTIGTDVAVERAAARGLKTGRFVKESVIRETHEYVSKVFPDAILRGAFDKTTLWDTTTRDLIKVMTSTGKHITVHDTPAWGRFIAKGYGGIADPPAIMGLGRLEGFRVTSYLKQAGAKEGRVAVLPKGIKRMPAKMCYKNASRLVLGNKDYAYVEGIAYPKGDTNLGFLHAWAVDVKTGKVIDPTWVSPEKARYFGVTYDRSKYIKHLTKTEQFGVLGGDVKVAKTVMRRVGLPAAPEFKFVIDNVNASAKHVAAVNNVINTLPSKIRNRMAKANIRIRTGELVSDISPKTKGVRPRGWTQGTTWDNADGFYSGSGVPGGTNDVAVTEKYIRWGGPLPPGAKETSSFTFRIPYIVRHEGGHGYDEAVGIMRAGKRYSSSPAFKRAYKIDLANIKSPRFKGDFEDVSYFVQPGSAGREETFAEVFNEIMSGSYDFGLGKTSKHFPNVLEHMKGLLL